MFAISRQTPDYSAYIKDTDEEEGEHVLDSGDENSFLDKLKFWQGGKEEKQPTAPVLDEPNLIHGHPGITSAEEDLSNTYSAEEDWAMFDEEEDDRFS